MWHFSIPFIIDVISFVLVGGRRPRSEIGLGGYGRSSLGELGPAKTAVASDSRQRKTYSSSKSKLLQQCGEWYMESYFQNSRSWAARFDDTFNLSFDKGKHAASGNGATSKIPFITLANKTCLLTGLAVLLALVSIALTLIVFRLFR